MRKSRKKSWGAWRRLARDTRGTEIAEAAVVLPMLFMILMGIFWFGQAFRIYGTLTQATRAGARAAVAPVCATCPGGTSPVVAAQTAVQNVLAAAHLSTNQLVVNSTWTTPARTLYQCGSAKATQVTCAGTDTVCVQSNVQLSYPVPTNGPGGMGTCGTSVSVRYVYPFPFPIPFTNLDLAKIQLSGQAEVRGETQ